MAACLLALLVAGCTNTVIYEADGEVRVERGFGITRLTAQPGAQPQIIQSSGLGINSRDGALSIGYFSADTAVLPVDDCRIVVWLDNEPSPAALAQLKALGGSVCTLGPGAQTLTGGEKR